MENDDIHVTIKGLIPSPSGCGVFLSDGDKVIAIFVDHGVAAAITMYLHQVSKPRPLTHDLITNILAGLGATIEKVVIYDLKDDTFYARLYIKQENEIGRNYIEVDSRPSDSMALAVQQNAPIYVVRKIWDETEDMTWAMDELGKE